MTKLDLHYVDPRLVDLYDIENPHGPDTDFFIRLAADLKAQRILDLGCGTGLLTSQLAVDGRTVIGVDPSVSGSPGRHAAVAARCRFASPVPGACSGLKAIPAPWARQPLTWC